MYPTPLTRYVFVQERRWKGWRNNWCILTFGFELLDIQLSKLDFRGRRPSQSHRWRAPKPIPAKQVSHVMRLLKLFLKRRDPDTLDKAQQRWSTHAFADHLNVVAEAERAPDEHWVVGAVIRFFSAARQCVCDLSPACTLQVMTKALTLSATELETLELSYRLNDFTDGRGAEVIDEDVKLACMAAYEIGKFEIAREIALRGLSVA